MKIRRQGAFGRNVAQDAVAPIGPWSIRGSEARTLGTFSRVAGIVAVIALATARIGFCQLASVPLLADVAPPTAVAPLAAALPDAPEPAANALAAPEPAASEPAGPDAGALAEALQASSPVASPISAVSTGSITGVALDVNGGIVPDAKVTLLPLGALPTAQTTSAADGSFSFAGLSAGTYRVKIEAPGLETYMSPAIPFAADQSLVMPTIGLRMSATSTTMDVTASPEQVAQEQVHEQEQQRVLGVFPNFYTSYIWKAAPMTPRQKFGLALRATVDPVTLLMVAGIAGAEQYQNTFPDYGSGFKGYATRYGARYADTVTSRMFSSAVFPSILHQDPRYFYRGTGSIGSRTLYAMTRAYVTRGDNGRSQPNFSHLLGNLVAASIANAYRPASDRSATLTFGTFGVTTGIDIVGNIAREFLLRVTIPSMPTYANGKSPRSSRSRRKH